MQVWRRLVHTKQKTPRLRRGVIVSVLGFGRLFFFYFLGGVGLFQRVETPILGIIENMSYFVCPSDGLVYNIFGEGGGEREAQKLGVPLLGRIPLDIETRSCGDEGAPVALKDPGQSMVSAAFQGVATMLASVLGE